MRVMFAVPSYRGMDCLPFLDSLKATTTLFVSEGIECQLSVQQGNCYIQAARNNLAHAFLKSDADKLFFLDDDVSWEPQAALRLVRAKYPFVGGVYPMKAAATDSFQFPVVLKCSDNGIPFVDGEYLRAVRTVGGFTCVDRSVLTRIKEANPHLEYEELNPDTGEAETKFDFFPQGVRNRRWEGEDYAFCDLWTSLGEEIYIFPDIGFGHHRGERAWYGNLLQYLLRLPGGKNEALGVEDAVRRV